MNRTPVRARRSAGAFLLAVAAAGAVGYLGGHAALGSEQPAMRPAAARAYLVRPGDTVWGIAERLAAPGSDPRPLVDALIRANHLRGARVAPGERLVVPQV